MRNIEFTYNLNGRETGSWTSTRSFERYDYLPWDEEESFIDHLKNIKWKIDDWHDPYSDFVEFRSGKPTPKAPKLPESYPKEDLNILFGMEGD